MSFDLGKFDIKLESNEGLEELLLFLQKQSIDLLPENRDRIVRRLRFMARRHGYKEFTSLLELIKSDDEVLKNLLSWMGKEKEVKQKTKTYEPPIKKPVNRKERKERKRKRKRAEVKLITKLPLEFGIMPDPIDTNNLTLIYDFLTDNKINYKAYKEKYFLRRLHVRMRRTGSLTYRDYSVILRKDDSELPKLITNLSINVTKFFRDTDLYDVLEKDILPKLYETRDKSVKIWSAGCAIGAEPYSIAILVSHLFKQTGINKTDILATDINSDFLVDARKGEFHRVLLQDMKPIFTQSYFKFMGDNKYEISPKIIKNVSFQVHDLRESPPAKNFDLILCRNVLIYFSRSQSEKLFKDFYDVLNPGGYLVLGKCELIPPPVRSQFKTIHSRTRVYQPLK